MNIQSLKEWAESEKEKAYIECRKLDYDLNDESSLIPRRLYLAFSQIITATELILSNSGLIVLHDSGWKSLEESD